MRFLNIILNKRLPFQHSHVYSEGGGGVLGIAELGGSVSGGLSELGLVGLIGELGGGVLLTEGSSGVLGVTESSGGVLLSAEGGGGVLRGLGESEGGGGGNEGNVLEHF